MDSDIKKKIFPPNSNFDNLEYDDVGLYSITLPSDADFISKLIAGETGTNSIILDGTAGLGGNSISFCKYFKHVISIELEPNRFIMLKNNIKSYDFKNITIINDNFLNHLNDNVQAYYFDPPWGGPDYKKPEMISITINNLTLFDIVKKIRENNQAPIFFKLPYNYDLKEFNQLNYMINKIKNYQIITII